MKPGAVLLTPGAGSTREHSSLVALEKALAPLAVERVDFPYRRAGRRAPDRPAKLIECIHEEAAALAKRAKVKPGSIVLGGRSMGGRMCSMAVAEGLPARGLVLISYPLHPPGKPDSLRVDHFPSLDVPCLFVQGTRDPFGTPEELRTHTKAIPGAVSHVWIEGARHELKNGDDAIVDAVKEWLATLR